MTDAMNPPHRNAVPKLEATRILPTRVDHPDERAHDEGLIDESVDESFPASDPPASVQPGSTLAVKGIAQDGRQTPRGEPDPAKENLTPCRG